tara:strand:- start:735 stop:1262 length:528 start_codon:yes stop_codon:yes gene_type:complete
MFSLGAIAVTAVVDPVIDEFTVTAAAQTQLSPKDVHRGYRVSFVLTDFGSVSPSTITIANGHTADTDSQQNFSGVFPSAEFVEIDPASGGSNSMKLGLVFPNESATIPTNNDANYFKSLKIINNTQSTTTTIQRSDMTFGFGNDSDGTGYFVTFSKTETLNISANDSVKVQLRSD